MGKMRREPLSERDTEGLIYTTSDEFIWRAWLAVITERQALSTELASNSHDIAI